MRNAPKVVSKLVPPTNQIWLLHLELMKRAKKQMLNSTNFSGLAEPQGDALILPKFLCFHQSFELCMMMTKRRETPCMSDIR